MQVCLLGQTFGWFAQAPCLVWCPSLRAMHCSYAMPCRSNGAGSCLAPACMRTLMLCLVVGHHAASGLPR